jgi:hypothetical protein
VSAAGSPWSEQRQDSESEPYARSWQPVDLTSVLDGSWQPPKPTIGLRDDGLGLFYPGKVHTIASETEAGKTWLALIVVAEQLALGHTVVYLDFEDDEGSIVNRLRVLQVGIDAITERFCYVRPDVPLGSGVHRDDMRETLQRLPSACVVDGITAAMSLHDLDPVSNSDVARFLLLPKMLADCGAAVLCLDHVTKSSEGRGRYALGAAHKLNGLTGAAYLLDNRTAFGIEKTGRSTIRVSKDRPGQVRRYGQPAREGTSWVADLVLESEHVDFAVGTIEAPQEHVDDWQPTYLMDKVAKLLADSPEGLSQRTIEQAIGGKAANVRRARALLTAQGFVTDATPYTLIKPYQGEGS